MPAGAGTGHGAWPSLGLYARRMTVTAHRITILDGFEQRHEALVKPPQRPAVRAFRALPTMWTIRGRIRTASYLFRGHPWRSRRYATAPHRQDRERTQRHHHTE